MLTNGAFSLQEKVNQKKMKKLSLLLIVLLPLLLSAQSLRFSLIADPQFSWMMPDSKKISSQGAVFGINAGMGMDYYFTENYAFSTGISINNIGGKLMYSDTISVRAGVTDILIPKGNTITYKLQYLNIPLGLKFKTNEIGYVTYTANLGISPMVNIRDRATDVSGSLDNDNISDDILLFNLNYFINMGVQYSLGGSTALIGGVGYSSGFVDVTTRAIDKIYIKSLSIKLGILF